MPDVISDVQTMNLNRVDDFMDDQHGDDPLFSRLNGDGMNLLSLDQLAHDPMLSASSSSSNLHNHHQQQRSTVDMSAIDPIITNYGLLSSMQHQSNCDSASVESILHSDSDSLISDIDMLV
jgi:hypothetical protein